MENFGKEPRYIQVCQHRSPERIDRSAKELGEGRIINRSKGKTNIGRIYQ